MAATIDNAGIKRGENARKAWPDICQQQQQSSRVASYRPAMLMLRHARWRHGGSVSVVIIDD